jgi:hypothetical protein
MEGKKDGRLFEGYLLDVGRGGKRVRKKTLGKSC